MSEALYRNTREQRPLVEEAAVREFLRSSYGIDGRLNPLPSERDQNFRVIADDGGRFTLKITSSAEESPWLEAENEAMCLLAERGAFVTAPLPIASADGRTISEIAGAGGTRHLVRLLSWIDGEVMADCSVTSETLSSLGRMMGDVARVFESHNHAATHREFYWDLQHAEAVVERYRKCIEDPERRALVDRFLRHFREGVSPALRSLRRSVIHNDANDRNVIVNTRGDHSIAVGVIDFGDMVHSCTVFELAVACAYGILECDDPVGAATAVIRGFREALPLEELEVEILFDAICTRLCMSVCIAAHQAGAEPDNEYLSVSQREAWRTLEILAGVERPYARASFRAAAGFPDDTGATAAEIGSLRRAHLGPSFSTSYRSPLKIVRGQGQYLYDDTCRAYLDAVNNVPHVGHCHPGVVRAGQRQMARLNTNTRYLHDSLARYVERLTATFPDPLEVCFPVNSGSEANDLALRLARAHTGRTDVIVLDGAYHGNLTTLVDISPYKFDGPGGAGAPEHVSKVAMPDSYRGPHRGDDAGARYAEYVGAAVAARRGRLAAFVAESVLGCGGQILLPDGYLSAAYRYVRDAGGVCIADEVQVGFGRVGSHFWGFELQGVVPDIVTLGKPMGNGHPLGAVVTTRAIAESFDTGMEYFNTFGGNPVSCEIGLAVLDAIEDEGLQQNALTVGARLLDGLKELQERHEIIGDVRGAGLFLGVELVRDRSSLEPAASEAAEVVETMKDRGILLSTDGPLRNVIKIKPPLVFTEENAEHLVKTLSGVLADLGL